MRLTLRTLLAYMNDVLSPEEAEQLKHRVEESEFASTLVQRIRHVLRRLRLSAPKVDGRGVGFDPNSVAEYLDSTMPPDRVIEFEKVCLESDVHLAEVAAGYEILAKVLHEHAEVPERLRARIQALTERAQEEVAAPPIMHTDNGKAAAAAATEPAAPPLPVVERAKPQVPDYLKPEPREKSPGNAWLLLPVGLLALIGIAFFVPPLSQYNPLLKPTQVADNSLAGGNLEDPETVVTPPDGRDNDKVQDDEPVVVDPQPMDDGDDADTTPAVVDVDPTEATKGPIDDAVLPPIDPDQAVVDSSPTDTEDEPPMPPEPMPPEGSAVKPEVKPDPVSPEPSEGAELGRYISDETVLASFNFKTRQWMRVPPRALIVEGEQCVSLPVYRPQVGLSSGVQVTMAGETSLLFARDEESGLPLLLIDYGRLLLHSNALQQARTSLSFGGLQGVLTLESAKSMAAVEVYNYLAPGSDPLLEDEKPAGQLIVNLIGVSGECTWEQAGEAPISITANSVQIIVDGNPARKRTRIVLPAWIEAINTDRLDRESAKMVEPLLPADRPLTLSLQELTSHRRLDVRVHVARSLAFLGQFEPLVRQIADEQYKSYWTRPDGHLETLRKQLARGGKIASQIKADMIAVRGEKDGGLMFRLLQGFSNEQLVKGDKSSPLALGYDEQLVKLLAHPSLDVRVLAFDNLNRITGSTHLYNPVQTPDRSRPRIKAWQDVLDKGGIRYAAEPSPLPEFKSLEIETAGEGKER